VRTHPITGSLRFEPEKNNRAASIKQIAEKKGRK